MVWSPLAFRGASDVHGSAQSQKLAEARAIATAWATSTDSLGLNWTRHVITVTLPHALSANECQRRAVPYYGSPAPSSSLPSDQTNSSPAAQPKPRPSTLHLVRSLSMDLPHLPNPKFLLVWLCRHLQHQKPIGLDHMMFRLLHSNSRRTVLRGLLHHCP